MAEDLRRYVNRFAISARRAGPLHRAKKWVKRNPAVAIAGSLVLVAATAAGFFAWQAKQDRELLRAEQRQTAMDTAILEALSGDPPAALDAILDAENKGAEPGQLNLLRGAVEVYRGRPKEALTYLDQAERQLPDSAAVPTTPACSTRRSYSSWPATITSTSARPSSTSACGGLGKAELLGQGLL